MSSFFVNGHEVTTEAGTKLLDYLRDELRLTSVKDGCSEGACGTCMVLVDGKAQKACTLRAGKLEGKRVLTLEGFSSREREVYAYAFKEAGAVQCGFCIPGMVVSAKALLDQTPSPSREEVKRAIRFNICRCTGYKKIEEAILLAAQLLREQAPVPPAESTGRVGAPLHRVDAGAKALGEAPYAADLYFDGMVYGSAVRSRYPRARIKAIRTARARALPGVLGVFTAQDVPGAQRIGHLIPDWPVMVPVGEVTRFLGDAVALVAAETKAVLEEAKTLVEVDYEPLPGVFDPGQALLSGAVPVHPDRPNLLSEQRLVRGDAQGAIAKSKHVVTHTYRTPWTEHAFLEPETAVARPWQGGVEIYSGDQGCMQTRKENAAMLNLPLDKVRVITCMVGGGFGGKEDQVVQHHAALLAYLLQRPVKVSLTRAESMQIHSKRHPMTIEMTTGCDERGIIQGMVANILTDTGAYASLGGPVLQRACTHASGPYQFDNIRVIGRAVYTNNPPAGPFRGFGVTQSCFAAECNLNQLARLVGISPWEIRRRNAILPGNALPNGQVVDENCAFLETLEAVKPYYDANPRAGIACAFKNTGLGVGIPDYGRCLLRVRQGKVEVHCSASCIGQGFGTVAVHMVCTGAGLSPDAVVYCPPDTAVAPDSGNTTASRQTLFSGEAASRAARQLKEAVEQAGEGGLATLEGREFYAEYLGQTDPMGSDKPHPVSHVDYGYATQLVELDGDGRLLRVVAAHDVGRAINLPSLTGQIEGGVVMSLGYALTERFPLEQGKPQVRFGGLGLFTAPQVPHIETILVEKSTSSIAHGAKGIGEITAIPTPPAVQDAYYNFDGVFRTQLPLADTPYQKKR